MLRPRKKHTVFDLQQLKGQRVLTHIHIKSPEDDFLGSGSMRAEHRFFGVRLDAR
jgi:hypothetical protein